MNLNASITLTTAAPASACVDARRVGVAGEGGGGV